MKEEELKAIARWTDQPSFPTYAASNSLDVDWQKILRVFRKHIWAVVLFPGLALFGAYLYLRYTKPVYQAQATLKLISKLEAQVLPMGMRPEWDNILLGELEVIRSPLIYEQVLNELPLYVSYHAEGRILEEELYKRSPFEVKKLTIHNPDFYEKRFYIKPIDQQTLQLAYVHQQREHILEAQFGKPLSTDDFQFIIESSQPDQLLKSTTPLYFVVHTDRWLYDYLQANLEARIQNQLARVIEISFSDYDARKAADIVNAVIRVYTSLSIDMKNKANKQKEKWLEGKLQETEAHLGLIEQDIERFILDNKDQDITADVTTYIQLLKELTRQKTLLEEELKYLQKIEQIVTDSLPRPFIYLFGEKEDTNIQSWLLELNKIKQEVKTLRLSVRENTLAFQKLQMQLRGLQEQILFYIGEKKRFLLQKLYELNREIARSERDFSGVPAKSREFSRLQKNYSIIENYYNELLNQRIQLGLAAAGTIPDFELLSPATPSFVPIRPNKELIYLSSIAGGIFAAALWIIIQYFLHNTIDSIQELERLTALPILGGLPKYRHKEMEVSQIVVQHNPKAFINEAFRTIRTNMDFLLPHNLTALERYRHRTITVSSTISGEGKTFVSLNLGATLAFSGLRVVLMDFDLRRPRLHLSAQLPNHYGVSTLLIGRHDLDECIYTTTVENLYVVPAGPIPPNPSELILSPRLQDVLGQAKQRFDLIIIDTPPVGLVTDGVLLMKQADIRLFVVRANYSKKHFVKDIEQQLRIHQLGNTALVLNALVSRQKRYGYGYGYYDDQEHISVWSRLTRFIGIKGAKK